MQLTGCYCWRRVLRSAVPPQGEALILVCFILLASASFVALPGAAAHAQAGKVHRIGFLRDGQPPQSYVQAFQQGLRELGYVDGRNVVIEFRIGSVDQLPQLAEELVRRKVDVIVASSAPAALAAKKATTSVPIVFVNVFDPVELGLVPNLARPGENITGLAFSSADLAGKRLELLKEVVPKLRRVAMLWHSDNPGNLVQLKGAEIAARTLGMQFEQVPVRSADDFDAGFRAMRGADGLLQANAPLFTTHRARLVGLAAKSRLPVIYGQSGYVEVGGLMSYGPNIPDQNRHAATYVDKILKGAKPADLPVEQPTKFEFTINNKTAQILRLTIPPSLRLRADHIVE